MDDAAAAYLVSLWVAPNALGRGTGDALLHGVATWACGQRFRRLILNLAVDNHPALRRYQRLYERCGSVTTGVHGTLPPPRTHVREVQMALGLGSAEEATSIQGYEI